ncbi:ATP-binding protein [Microscilla marina]|uniref:ATP-binding protein n=1 Tax=Microscilla marina TaxID=1027 RepID=UPI0009E331B0|nr:ATP-binding protein [Microscilla marina]
MKRHLNRIVLINSTAVRYAEMKVDGNIHFVGSNGFGKTTVLRAILYFYNPDNRYQLGIRRDQLSFTEYYFQQPNARIIYEVKRDDGYYHILLFRKNNRVHYRFIDAPYDASVYIEDTRIKPLDEVLQTLHEQHVHFEETIERSATYKEVLYGASREKKWRKYSLIPTRGYLRRKEIGNIPKTVSNVFLSSRLESDYIKNAIMEAVMDENPKIDLDTLRRHLASFSDRLDDVTSFNEHKDMAEEVVTMFDSLEVLKREQKRDAEQLGNSVQNANRKIGELRRLLNQENDARQKLSKGYEKEKHTFDKNTDLFKEAIGEIKGKLREVDGLKQKYQGIKQKLELHQQRPTLHNQLTNLKKQLTQATAAIADVQQMFEQGLQDLENQKSAAQNRFGQQQNTIERETQAKAHEIQLQFDESMHATQQNYATKFSESDALMAEVKQRLGNCEREIAEARQQVFFAEEIDQIEALIKNAHKETETRQQENKLLSKDVNHEKALYQNTLESLENTHRLEQQTLENKLTHLQQQIAEVDHRLEGFEGSLYEFLEQEKPNWTQDIGQVIDEKLLFRKDLSPALTPSPKGDFWGLNIDLSAIGKRMKTLADYAQDKKQLLEGLNKTKKQLLGNSKHFQEKIEQSKQRHTLKIKEWQGLIQKNEYQNEQAQLKNKERQNELLDIEQRAEQQKKTTLDQLNEKQEALRDELAQAQTQLNEWQQKQQAETTRLNNEKAAQIGAIQTTKEQALETAQRHHDEAMADYEAQKQALAKQREERVAGRDIDKDELTQIEQEIAQLTEKLHHIDHDITPLVNLYQLDKERLLDKETGLKLNLDTKIQALDDEKASFKQLTTRHKAQLAQLDASMQQNRQYHDQLENELLYFEDKFKLTDVFTPLRGWIESPDAEDREVLNIDQLMKDLNLRHTRLIEDNYRFQKLTHSFTGLFSADNRLEFPRKFATEIDYKDFVRHKLKPFLAQNRIDIIQQQLEQQHSKLIDLISKDIVNLSAKSDEINQTIERINADFSESNFVGVVKSIALDYREKKSGLINVLKKIRAFEQEHVLTDQLRLYTPAVATADDQATVNKQSIALLTELKKAIENQGKKYVTIEDTFELYFRVQENNNNTGWVERLANVGSEGTDVLVKAMIYITLLNVFKENAFKGNDDYFIHCLIDEVGKLSDRYLRELIDFTNHKNIRLIFGSPNENDPLIYEHVYKVHRENDEIRVIELLGVEM